MTNFVKATNQATFESDVVIASRPVLVDFYADWCGPCKTVAPLVEDLASQYDGQVDFTKVDVDRNPELASTLGIRSIPTLMLFKDGKPVETIVGSASKTVLANFIDQQLTE